MHVDQVLSGLSISNSWSTNVIPKQQWRRKLKWSWGFVQSYTTHRRKVQWCLRWTFGQPRFFQPQLVRSSDWLVEPCFFPLSDKGTAGKGECLCCVDKRRDTGAELFSRFFLFPWKENLENSLETLLKLFSATLPQFQERAQCSPACICAKAYFHPCQQKNRLKVWLQQTAGSPSR